MKTLTTTSIATGLIAGVTAALLSLSATAQSFFSVVLYAASALPILIAGLRWGNASAMIAVIVGGVLASALISPYFALLFVIFTLVPAGWLSNLANLARPASELGGPSDALAWYPLSSILAHLSAIVVLGMIVVGRFDYIPTGEIIDVFVQAMKAKEPLFNPDDATIAQMKSVLAFMFPLTEAALRVLMLFAAYYIASLIVRMSGKGLRPREDMPSTLRMHRNAIFVFLAGLLISFMGGMMAFIGAIVCGAFGAGFVLAGFASLHFKTRGKPWRLFALWFTYFSVLVFAVIPILATLILGLTDTRRTIALTPTGPADNKNQNI